MLSHQEFGGIILYRNKQHLAWHETLEMHELVAFQSNHLMGFKMTLPGVTDPQLRALYEETIRSLEKNLKELLPYFSQAPVVGTRSIPSGDLTAFHAAHLLLFAKTAVRNYAIAITETATPQLRETFQKQLNNAINLHGKVFYFMLERNLYPAYNLDQLLADDVKNAKKAMQL
ncbi:spore coat protein [Paenibacillus sp. J22TS3]|uniref:spore coat protein n=1 Tax=Paenibacillus sp. J22TS3 TaxID=2807192 RepID=UPI001BCB742E|nr:spore coat protein [Paenibacillus sp. J22TS3]